MPDQHDEIPTILPNLLTHTAPVPADQTGDQPAEQGPQMTGSDETSTDANVALDEAESIIP